MEWLGPGSEEIEVVLHKDALDGLESISVKDLGSGIDHSHVESLSAISGLPFINLFQISLRAKNR